MAQSPPLLGGGGGGGGASSLSGPGSLGSHSEDVYRSAGVMVTKHSWKGKYKRLFWIGPRGLATLNPSSMEATNRWNYSDVLSIAPMQQAPTANVLEFQLVLRKGKKTDSMRFSSEHRAYVLTQALSHHDQFAEPLIKFPHSWNGIKHHWSDQKKPVILKLAPHALQQFDPSNMTLLASYNYKDISCLYNVDDFPGGFVVQDKLYGRLHLFGTEAKRDLMQKLSELALAFVGVHLEKAKAMTFDQYLQHKFGKFSNDLDITSISEFLVYKQSSRHPEPVRRNLCLSETCLIERDPASYSIVSLKPLSSISGLIRHLENTQLFSVQYTTGDVRSYTSTERDALLASFLDAVRGSGNRDVHVRMTRLELGKRLCPLDAMTDEDIESMHLKFLVSPPPGWDFAEAVSRFNANISYSGLAHAVTQEHLFAENKEKLIFAALSSLLNRDVGEVNDMPFPELEQQFHALRRLVASKAGFSAFTSIPGFREKIGAKVARSLKLGHDGISHSAIDMICTLMEPMHENYDLKQEQLNKYSLLSTEKFLEALLDMWTVHVTRGTGALVVASMLDFLTFALCSPYSETTDGKQFDMLLEKVADRGRTLYKLFQQPSHAIVKGAGLLMKAIIEEGNENIGRKMQLLALAEGALPIHLLTALFTKTNDNRLLTNCQLSRHLVGLWTADCYQAMEMLKRIFPAGLLHFLESSDSSPTHDKDRLHVRDNLKMAFTDVESNKGNALLRAAGLGLRQGKAIASKTAEVVSEKTYKYTEVARREAEKQFESAMTHWRTKMGDRWALGYGSGAESGDSAEPGSASAQQQAAAQKKNHERPIVLRKRRERVKASLNWPMFYFMFEKDHAMPSLIWNFKTRQELKVCLEHEIQSFLQDRELGGKYLISWNYTEFEVTYQSLAEEIKIGDYFLRLLLEEDQATSDAEESPINKSGEFFNDLYHRFLLTPKIEMKCLCLRAMTIVYGRHYEEIGSFHDTKYILAMLERTCDRTERDRLLLFLNKLVLHSDNAQALAQANGVRILIDLLPLAHLHTKRAITNSLSTAIEVDSQSSEDCQEKEWYYGNADKERNGPVSFAELCRLFEEKQIHSKTKVWAQGLDGWKLLHQVAQLKWKLMAKGTAVMNESEMASLILGMLIRVCQYYPSTDEDGAIIRPLPKVKQAISDSTALPHVVQLLLTFDPILVEKVAILLNEVLDNNPKLSSLYLTGCFFFILMYTGSNIIPIGKFLSMAHMRQAFRSEENHSNDIGKCSILGQMIPDAMVAYLENHGPDKFAEIFLGDFDTPEAIWSNEMRQFLIQKIAYHLADFTPRLKSNVRALYQYCPIPKVSFPPLENELFCDIFYLRNLCDTSKFPDWPITNPLQLLKEVLFAWKTEVEKKPMSMTVTDALKILGITAAIADSGDQSRIRKAYFKMAQQYHPDKNPKGREMFEKVNSAYEFLCSQSNKASDKPDADNLVLILRTQSILFDRYSTELHPYKYAGYPMLIKTIERETVDEKLFSKSAPLLAAAAECAYFTVKCSALNAEEMRRENGLEVLFQAFERCVSVLSQSSAAQDIAVLVCQHVIRFYSVASLFPSCREKIVEMPELVKNICRIFYYKQLVALSSVSAECVAALAVDGILQMHFLQSGVLWHLLLSLFDYDYTFEESGVAADEATSKQAGKNKLAKLCIQACSMLAGLIPAEEGKAAAPKNPVIEECIAAMLTPYAVTLMREQNVEEVLKILNSNHENPYLIWDNGTRAELTDFLENERTSSVRRGTCDPTFGASFKFSSHQDELVVGDIFVKIYNRQPMFQLKDPKKFAVDLLQFLNSQAQYLISLLSMNEGTDSGSISSNEKLLESEMALEALANVIKHNKGVEIQCIGHFKLLFCLLRLQNYPKIQSMTIRVLSTVTGSKECIDDIAACGVLPFLIQVLYSKPDNLPLALAVLNSLVGDTRLVKETLHHNAIVCLLYHFCCSQEQQVREAAADILSKMSADKLMGPKVKIALNRFLPEVFLDAVRKSAEAGIIMFESEHENPELIWNAKTKQRLTMSIKRLAESHLDSLLRHPEVAWTPPEALCGNLSVDSEELVVAGIYVRLFIANPGWVLRKPREFLSESIEMVLVLMKNRARDQKRLEDLTLALVKLLTFQPALADMIPATGYLSRLFETMDDSDESGLKAAVLIINELSRSTICIENMANCACITCLRRAMTLRPDLVGLICEVFSRIFTERHESLVKQALDCNLPGDLLNHLESPTVDPEARAFIVKTLKGMQGSMLYGEQISKILRSNPIWEQFEQQRHDLFVKSQTSTNYLTSGPGVAGYLTAQSAPAPMMPPPMDESNGQTQQQSHLD